MSDSAEAKASKSSLSEVIGNPMDPVTVTDARLDDKRFLLDGVDFHNSKGEIVPLFTVSEIAKFFFGRTSYWVRWCETQGHLNLDGVEVGTDRTKSGARQYTLADVELMAHALASNAAITGRQLNDALLLVATNARVWGYI